MHPSEVITVEALPLLGSGKTDYVELDRLVRGKLGLPVGA
jgi:3-hydroxyacyl-CoA dehydrogenase